MQLTKRERPSFLLIRQLLAILGLGVFFGLAGPFGTYPDLVTTTRYIYWIGLLLIGYLNVLIVAHAFQAMPLLKKAPEIFMVILIALVSAIPTTFVVAWAESLLRLGRAVPFESLPELYMSVAAVQILAVVLLMKNTPFWQSFLFTPRQESAGESNNGPADSPHLNDSLPADFPSPPSLTSSFHRRLPASLGTELLALEAEDHYVRVYTRLGSGLILLRLSDALAELDRAAGCQVHRSWWVAYKAVTHITREQNRITLHLANNVEIPVSRTYLATVRAVAWPNITRPQAA